MNNTFPVGITDEAVPADEEALKRQRLQELADLLKAIASPARLGIIGIIAAHPQIYSVQELNTFFDLEQPTISHHLQILKNHQLISLRRSGLFSYYYPNLEKLSSTCEALLAALFPESIYKVQVCRVEPVSEVL